MEQADLDRFYHVAMAAVCHCYDHTKGLYPDNCGCEERKAISEAMQLLIAEHKRISIKLKHG